MNPPQPGPLPTRALPEWLSLAGGVAIVTGGGTHLGLAMATALADGPTSFRPAPPRCRRKDSMLTRSVQTRPTRWRW